MAGRTTEKTSSTKSTRFSTKHCANEDKNQVSGVEVKAKADHECESSAAPVSQTAKWSHEAIVARSNMRPIRREKLNRAVNSGQNPGFEFLQECWDDPALQIVIKKLLAKFPQWGIAIVDGVLVKWNE
ncbi:hypothetical protein [Nostoc flagelliforme]|nr:hypothetical protein [Nostoc flagelliforme]